VLGAFAVGMGLSVRADRRDARQASRKTSPSTA
jgi:hypothetical protein